MIVDDLRQEETADWIEVSAQLTWEETDRSPQRLRFEVGKSLAADVECSSNAFLVATAVPAAHFGERRLKIDGTLCPELRDGVETVLTQHREWYDQSRPQLAIEATRGLVDTKPRNPGRAAQMFSGGIDAWATLRRNRLMHSQDHPSYIRECLHVYGLHPVDFRDGEPCPERVALWWRAIDHIKSVSEVTDVEFHLLRTNAHGVFAEKELQAWKYHSATLLSLGHLLTRRLHELSIASSDYIGNFHPWGSHPLIDPYYGSSSLRIRHDATHLRRIDKVRLVAEWPEALSRLNVCVRWDAPTERFNCGTCDKCLRTMIMLLICGKLHEASTFPVREVDPVLIKDWKLLTGARETSFDDMIPPLREIGRDDIADALKARAAQHYAWLRRKQGYGWKSKVRKLDDALLFGWLRKTVRSTR